jgi:hypothetical protein
VLQDVAPAAFSAGIVFGILLRFYEGRPLVAKIKSRQVKEPVVDPEVVELEKTETFLAVMHDDTQDDIRLKNYKPVKIRNRAPLAITARPSNTLTHMASIRSYMQEHGPNAQHTKVMAKEVRKD